MAEPVNERPIFPALTAVTPLGVAQWTTSMIRQLTTVFQQYGYRLNQALLEENLSENGGNIAELDQVQTWTASQTYTPAQVFSSAPTAAGNPLRYNELAANGGTVPETDQNNTFTGTNDFEGQVTVSDPVALDAEGWNTPTLLNSWVDYGTPYQGARYRKLASGLVLVQGLIRDGTTTANTVLFTLPAGYRPANRLMFVSLNNNGLARVDVEADGDVIITGVTISSGWVDLELFFYADQ